MRRPARIALGGLTCVAASGAAAVVALFLVVDRASLRTEVQERLAGLLGRDVSLGEVSLTLWGGFGVKVNGIDVGPSRPGRRATPALSARQARVRVGLLPYLRGRVVLRSLSFEQGTLRIGDRVLLEQASLGMRFQRSADGTLRARGRLSACIPVSGMPRGDVRFAVSLVEDRLVVETASLRLGDGSLDASGEVTRLRSSSPETALRVRATLRNTSVEGTVLLNLTHGKPEVRFDLRAPRVDLGELGVATLIPARLAAERPDRSAGSWLAATRGKGSLRADRASLAGFELDHLATDV